MICAHDDEAKQVATHLRHTFLNHIFKRFAVSDPKTQSPKTSSKRICMYDDQYDYDDCRENGVAHSHLSINVVFSRCVSGLADESDVFKEIGDLASWPVSLQTKRECFTV